VSILHTGPGYYTGLCLFFTQAQAIIDQHTIDRARQRSDAPKRFDHQITLGERAPRVPPAPIHTSGSLKRAQEEEAVDKNEENGIFIEDFCILFI